MGFIAKRPFLELAFRPVLKKLGFLELFWLGKILQASATKSFPALYEPKLVTGTARQL